MSPKEIAQLLKQSPENIRLWSIEFAKHLSKAAAPNTRGKHRAYDARDISVLALVADQTNRHIPFEQIHKALDDGERLTPVAAMSGAGDNKNEITALKDKIADLEAQLSTEQAARREAELGRAAAEGRENLLRELLAEANALLRK